MHPQKSLWHAEARTLKLRFGRLLDDHAFEFAQATAALRPGGLGGVRWAGGGKKLPSARGRHCGSGGGAPRVGGFLCYNVLYTDPLLLSFRRVLYYVLVNFYVILEECVRYGLSG